MKLLDNKLLRLVSSGEGVFVNLYRLSRSLKCHRDSAKNRLDALVNRGIITMPRCFYRGLFSKLPLFVMGFVDYPPSKEYVDKLKAEPHVTGLFKIRKGEYNLLFFSFFESLFDYKKWQDLRFYQDDSVGGSDSSYVPVEFIFKFDPNDVVRRLVEKNERSYAGAPLDDLSFKIMVHLLKGDFVSINSNYLSKKLSVHHKTVKNRINALIKGGVLDKPACFFPSFLLPPDRLLVITFIETRVSSEFIEHLKKDPHVIMLAKENKGKYTYIAASTHKSIATFTDWSENMRIRFKGVKAADALFVPYENVIKSDFSGLASRLLKIS